MFFDTYVWDSSTRLVVLLRPRQEFREVSVSGVAVIPRRMPRHLKLTDHSVTLRLENPINQHIWQIINIKYLCQAILIAIAIQPIHLGVTILQSIGFRESLLRSYHWQNHEITHHFGGLLTSCPELSQAGEPQSADVLSHALRQWHTWSWNWASPMLVCKYMYRMAQLPCWASGGKQELHQRWICWIQVTKHTRNGIHPGFET